MVPFDKDEMRQNLSLWFQDDYNAVAQWKLHNSSPSDLIPLLPVVGGIEPVEGWTQYLKGRDWKFWGMRIAIKGVWVGAIELEAMKNEAPVWSGSERSRAEGDYTILKGRSLRDSSSGNLCSVKL